MEILTATEFETWEKDAETLARVCTCTKREALTAIFKLREKELDRDLSPLIALVDWNYKMLNDEGNLENV